MALHNPAKALIDRIRGIDWISTIPPKFRSGLLYITTKIPGVDNAVLEDDLTGDIISSKVTTDRTNERQKETTTLDPTILAETIFHEQEYDEMFDVVVPTDNYLTARGAELSQPRREIHGINTLYDEVRTISPDTSVLDNYLLTFPGTTHLNLPDVLVSLFAVWGRHSGSGSYANTGSGFWSGSGGYHVNIRGESDASAAVIPDLVANIASPWEHNVPTIHYMFFLPRPVTAAQVLTKLNVLAGTVSPWPDWRPVAHSFSLSGQRTTLKVQADHSEEAGGNSCGDCAASNGSSSAGSGFSTEVGLDVRTVKLPPTIHPALSVQGPTEMVEGISADTQAWGVFKSADSSAAGLIFPASLPTTQGSTVIPSSGQYLLNVDAEPYKYGYVRIHCEVVDFSAIHLGTGFGYSIPPFIPGPSSGDWIYWAEFRVFLNIDDSRTGKVIKLYDSSDGYNIFIGLSGGLFNVGYGASGSEVSIPTTVTTPSGSWVPIKIKVSFDASASTYDLNVTIGSVAAAFVNDVSATPTFNRIRIGGIDMFSNKVSRLIDSVKLGSVDGSIDIFNGSVPGSGGGVIPPFQSATHITLAGTTLKCSNTGEAYAQGNYVVPVLP